MLCSAWPGANRENVIRACVDGLLERGRLVLQRVHDVELAQAARGGVGAAMQAILSQLASRMRTKLNEKFAEDLWTEVLERMAGLLFLRKFFFLPRLMLSDQLS